MRSESCPLFPVRSGVPLILGGLLLITMVIVGWILGREMMSPAIALLFVSFGVFLIWLGFSR